MAIPGVGWAPKKDRPSALAELLTGVFLLAIGVLFPLLLFAFPVFFLAIFCIPFFILGLLAITGSLRTASLKEELSLRDGRFFLTKNCLGWKQKAEGAVSSISFIYVRLKQRNTTDTSTGSYGQVHSRSLLIIQEGAHQYAFGEFLSYPEHEYIVSELAAEGIPARPPVWEMYSVF